MEPITILTYVLALLLGALPTMFGYSRKLGFAMQFLYDMLNIVSEFMKGNVDHEFTVEEKIALADAMIKLSKDVDESNMVDAILNFKFQ